MASGQWSVPVVRKNWTLATERLAGMDGKPTAGFHTVPVVAATSPPSQSPAAPLQTTPIQSATVSISGDMNEFLTSLSSGQPLLWAFFVLGVMAVAALSLTFFWGTFFRAAAMLRRGLRGSRSPAEGEDVLP